MFDPGYPNIEIIEGLRPGSAYIFRLTVIDLKGETVGPGPEFKFYTQGAYKDKIHISCAGSTWKVTGAKNVRT